MELSSVIVLDTHIWFWWINLEHDRLTSTMLAAIEGASRVGVSPVSCYELALANQRGRLQLPLPTREWFDRALSGSEIELLPLTDAICLRAVGLAEIHRDPFDRIIIATALDFGAELATIDGQIARYPELAGHLLA